MLGSDREGLGIGLGLGIRIADLNITPCFAICDNSVRDRGGTSYGAGLGSAIAKGRYS